MINVTTLIDVQNIQRRITVHYTLITVNYTLITVHYTLITVNYTLITVHYTLITVHYTLITVHYTLINCSNQGKLCGYREVKSIRQTQM